MQFNISERESRGASNLESAADKSNLILESMNMNIYNERADSQ